MLEYWYLVPGVKSRRVRTVCLQGEFLERRMLLAELVVVGQLVGRARWYNSGNGGALGDRAAKAIDELRKAADASTTQVPITSRSHWR
jgi:hypothetical protein